MRELVFPDHVEQFIEMVAHLVSAYGEQFEDAEEYEKSEARRYRVSTRFGPATVFVHRTRRSRDQESGEYRCRVVAPLPQESWSILRGMEDQANRYATLGALVTTREDASVLSQCLIEADYSATLAALTAVSAIHAAPSMVAGIGRTFAEKKPSRVEQLSAWTELDFEQIHYDYAHLSIGRLSRHEWTRSVHLHGRISLSASRNNPFWGAGLLCLSSIPRHVLGCGNTAAEINELNGWENLISNVPTFGGWCRDGENVVFVQFAPNPAKELPQITELMVDWAAQRLVQAPRLIGLMNSGQDETSG